MWDAAVERCHQKVTTKILKAIDVSEEVFTLTLFCVFAAPRFSLFPVFFSLLHELLQSCNYDTDKTKHSHFARFTCKIL